MTDGHCRFILVSAITTTLRFLPSPLVKYTCEVKNGLVRVSITELSQNF